MKSRFYTNPIRGMAIVLLTVVMPLSFLPSCNRDKNEVVEVFFDPQTSYTLKETNIETLISDSTGMTRVKITYPTCLVFSKASEPYQYFPDGLFLERYDTAFNVELSFRADTVYHYERNKLWDAKGNVDMTNVEGERFQSSQVFWDEQKKIIYTDSFIRFTKGDIVNTGIGFRSNEDLSEYEIYHSTLEIAVEMQQRAQAADSIPADSIPEQ